MSHQQNEQMPPQVQEAIEEYFWSEFNRELDKAFLAVVELFQNDPEKDEQDLFRRYPTQNGGELDVPMHKEGDFVDGNLGEFLGVVQPKFPDIGKGHFRVSEPILQQLLNEGIDGDNQVDQPDQHGQNVASQQLLDENIGEVDIEQILQNEQPDQHVEFDDSQQLFLGENMDDEGIDGDNQVDEQPDQHVHNPIVKKDKKKKKKNPLSPSSPIVKKDKKKKNKKDPLSPASPIAKKDKKKKKKNQIHLALIRSEDFTFTIGEQTKGTGKNYKVAVALSCRAVQTNEFETNIETDEMLLQRKMKDVWVQFQTIPVEGKKFTIDAKTFKEGKKQLGRERFRLIIPSEGIISEPIVFHSKPERWRENKKE